MAKDKQGENNEEQERLRTAAMTFVGKIRSGRSQRAENARVEVRSKIKDGKSDKPKG